MAWGWGFRCSPHAGRGGKRKLKRNCARRWSPHICKSREGQDHGCKTWNKSEAHDLLGLVFELWPRCMDSWWETESRRRRDKFYSSVFSLDAFKKRILDCYLNKPTWGDKVSGRHKSNRALWGTLDSVSNICFQHPFGFVMFQRKRNTL